MKRIIKISALALYIYGVSSRADSTTPGNIQDMIDRGRDVLDTLLSREQETKTGEIMERVEDLQKQIETADPASPDYQIIDSEKHSLVSELPIRAQNEIAEEFVAELKIKLDYEDENAVLRFLFSHAAPYFIGMRDIEYDEELAHKLKQVCSPDFQFRFRNIIKTRAHNRKHVLSVGRFVCFAMTGMTIKQCIIQFALGQDIPHAEFIRQMGNDIRNLFIPELDLDQLLGDYCDAKKRLYAIDHGVPSFPSANMDRFSLI